MSLERIQALVSHLRARVAGAKGSAPASSVPRATALELLESMLLARHLDVAAHQLRQAGLGHYTICSSGHEANAVLGRLTRVTDPALLHYRSAGFQLERARQAGTGDPVRDILASLVASTEDPISGGRHKVFGGKHLGIQPATSTIASHLPRAVGLALALERRRKLRLSAQEPPDALVVASFGDASLNHSTAQGALNAASWVLHQNLTLPTLFVCEDNGLGISVRTPEGWVQTRLAALPHLEVFSARAWELEQVLLGAEAAVRYVRQTRRAAVLHLSCARLLGHAGSDVDTTYRSPAELEAVLERDPVTRAACWLVERGLASAAEVLELDARLEREVTLKAEQAGAWPRLTSRAAVMAPLVSPVPLDHAARGAPPLGSAPEAPQTLAQAINGALAGALDTFPEALLFGEDVAKKGGVYGLTRGLLQRGGPARVFNTLLDEQTILGMALGAASAGLLPIPEIQYLAYLHNAEDQLRGEAATLPFFSQGAYDNPMLVRIAGLGYQRGFGGHFHNDNSLAVLRDVPGLVVGVPARADDAWAMYRAAFGMMREARRVVVMVEPIALYHQRDLYEPNDGEWLAQGAPSVPAADPLRARVYHAQGRDLTLVSYGNGVAMSLRVARRLQQEHGKSCRVLDLRWLVPLPIADVLEHAGATGRLLIVDEARRSGSPSEALAAALLDAGSTVRAARVCSADCFIPLGEAAHLVLLDEDEVYAAALQLLELPPSPPTPTPETHG